MTDKTALKEERASEETLDVQEPGLRKVDLDLDDAPFLKEKEEASAPAVPDATEPALPEQAPSSALPKKKKLVLLGAALALVLVGGAAVWWFFLRTPPPPPVAAVTPKVVVVPSKPTATPQSQEYVKNLEPFVIPRQTANGTRFLICKFSVVGKSPNLKNEIDKHLISLRDALYYYLCGKDDDYLLNAANVASIKKDLLGILNDYLVQSSVEDILLESYLNE